MGVCLIVVGYGFRGLGLQSAIFGPRNTPGAHRRRQVAAQIRRRRVVAGLDTAELGADLLGEGVRGVVADWIVFSALVLL